MASLPRLLLLVVLLGSLGAAAAPPPLAVPYLAEAPTIDGQADDWDGPPAADWRVFAHRPALRNRARVRFGWDENYLYALYQVSDRHLVRLEKGRGNPRLYFNDAVELYVDAPGDSRRSMDVNDYQFILDLVGAYVIFKGDKRAAGQEHTVPKDFGTATLLPRVAATHVGSINGMADLDSGYVVEVAVPWAGLGVEPRPGHRLRLDACVEDMDSVFNLKAYPEGRPLHVYSFESWTGSRDFGYPENWRAAYLTGGPGALARLTQAYPRLALRLAALLTALLGLLLAYHGWRVRQLRQIPVRAGLAPERLRQVAGPLAADGRPHPAAGPEAIPVRQDFTLARPDLPGARPAEAGARPSEAEAGPEEAGERPEEPGPRPVEAGARPEEASGGPTFTEPGQASSPAGTLPHEALFAQCRAFVLAHLPRDLGPPDLADHAAVGVRTLQRIFRDELDLTPAAFIAQVRLEEAAALLRQTPRPPIGEVADAVGFADVSYFGRVFKRYFGVTPREYGRGDSSTGHPPA